MSDYFYKGVACNDAEEAALAAEVPAYGDSVEAINIAQAVIDSDWLKAHDREVAAGALRELSARVAHKGHEWDRQSGEHAAGMSHAASKIRVYIFEQIKATLEGGGE